MTMKETPAEFHYCAACGNPFLYTGPAVLCPDCTRPLPPRARTRDKEQS